MADGTKIEWTDATVNAINGCTVVSPGCTNCYAMRLAGTRMKNHPTRAGLTQDSKAGPVWTGEVRLNEQALMQPLRWSKPRMIFWNAHGDMFHPAVPDEWIDRCFAVMALTPQHIHQVLTKRADRMREYLSARDVRARIGVLIPGLVRSWRENARGIWQAQIWPLSNVWLGVSVEDQQRADERIPDLLNTPAAVRWLSCEPLLGPIDLTRICLVPQVRGSARAGIHIDALRGRYVESGMAYIGDWDINAPFPSDASTLTLDWIVVGGESGPRPMHPTWARSLRDQCAIGVPFFFKQWGDWVSVSEVEGTGPHHQFSDGTTVRRVGKRIAGRTLDGLIHNAMPGAFAPQEEARS